MIPAGSMIGFYTAMAGFYAHKFHSRSFFLLCQASMYLLFPSVGLLQYFFDANFDKYFRSQVTYLFRVAITPNIAVLIVLLWMFMPQKPVLVLVVGVFLGFLAASITSSSYQLCAAMRPETLPFCEFGNLSAAALPVIVFTLTSFGPHSSMEEFKTVLLILIALCAIASAGICFFHVILGLFQKAFSRLEYDLSDAFPARRQVGSFITEGSSSFQRQVTETEPLLPTQGDKIPTWVWAWSASLGLHGGLSFFSLGLCAFVGTPRMAQSLALLKLGSDWCAGVLALVWRMLPYGGPMHYSLSILTMLRLLLFIPLTKQLLMPGSVPEPVFFAAWSLSHGIFTFFKPVVNVTTTQHVAVKDRKFVARTNFTCKFGGIFTGLLAALVFVKCVFGLGDLPFAGPSW